MAIGSPTAALSFLEGALSMKEDERPKQKPQKVVIVMDEERICYAAFVDPAQEVAIEKILFPPRYPN